MTQKCGYFENNTSLNVCQMVYFALRMGSAKLKFAKYSVFIGVLASPVCQAASAGTLDRQVGDVATRLEAASLSVCAISDLDGNLSHCSGEISIINSGSYNAWSRGGRIFLTRRLVDISSKDELAYVIAHEMAHVILQHPGSSIGNELEADYWAAKIMNRSGFDANSARSVLSRIQFRRIFGFPFSLLSHPSNSRRLKTIRQSIAEELEFNTAFSGKRDETGATSQLSRLP